MRLQFYTCSNQKKKNDCKFEYCCTFLVQPNNVKNEANDHKNKNSNYSCQDNVVTRALAFLSSYIWKQLKPPVCLAYK